jgi:hypothetical protein
MNVVERCGKNGPDALKSMILWRPRRDLNPCYRRERTTTTNKSNDLREAGGHLSPCRSARTERSTYRNPYREKGRYVAGRTTGHQPNFSDGRYKSPRIRTNGISMSKPTIHLLTTFRSLATIVVVPAGFSSSVCIVRPRN